MQCASRCCLCRDRGVILPQDPVPLGQAQCVHAAHCRIFLDKVRLWLCGCIYADDHTECDMGMRNEIAEVVGGVLVGSQGGKFCCGVVS